MDSETDATPSGTGGRSFLGFALIAGAAVLVSLALVLWIRGGAVSKSGGGFGGLAVGQPVPPIKAEGWINGEAPSADDLAGKVIVIDAWATWCVPCRIQVPKLIAAHEKYHGKGVVFLGLTAEEESELPEIQAFIEEMEIPWLNGYGANDTLVALEAYAIPAVWVIGRDGKVVWNNDSPGTVEDGIQKALAAAGETE